MSGRKTKDYKTGFVITFMVLFAVCILYVLSVYFEKRDAIKVDGGRVNPYASDVQSFGLDQMDELINSTTPDLESLESQFSDLQNIGQ